MRKEDVQSKLDIILNLNIAEIFGRPGLSFPRKRESRRVLKHWMPAYAGMTEGNL